MRLFHSRLALPALTLSGLAAGAQAQVVFSIDYRSVSIGTPATGGGCITAADLLSPPPAGVPGFGPLVPPMIALSGGFGPPAPGLGIFAPAACICPAPAMAACARELDAISFGRDARVKPVAMPGGTYVFSVDACSAGIAGGPLAPNVATETPVFDSAADAFESLVLPAAPVGMVFGPFAGNSGLIDGNGLISPSGALYRGVGIVEPRMPGAAITGDDMDALDIGVGGAVAPLFPAYFSLDGAMPNPCTGIPNTGSAMAAGFPPGAVLVTFGPGGPPAMYAPPPMLGLDLFGPGTDDLDALAICENGIAGFQVAPGPYTWLLAAPTDELFFSVRRGSAVIGAPDSVFGIPIEAGDILIPPVAGGLSPFPGIWVTAESLGLLTTRGGAAMPAELDALDVVDPPETGLPYCFGTAATCPCGNAGAPGNGCANSGNPAGANLAAAGLASVAGDTVVLTGSGMPPGSPALYFQGTAKASVPFGDGLLCLGGVITRLGVKFNNAVGSSTIPSGADPALSVMGGVPPAGGIRMYQAWYRDALVFCTPSTFNLTNAVAVVWTP
jgi:hypothetical protein